MFYVWYLISVDIVMIIYIVTKGSTINIEIKGVSIPLIWVKNIPDWSKASDGCCIEKCGRDHTAGELEGIYRTFPKIQESDKYILAIRGTYFWKLN